MIKKQLQKILKHRFLLKLLIRPVEEGSKSSKIYFVNVDPKSISHISLLPESSPGLSGPEALYGSFTGFFDLIKTPFKKNFMYRSVQQILHGRNFKSTTYFKKESKNESEAEALKRVKKLSGLMERLSVFGYLSQYEMGRANIIDKIGDWDVPRHETLIGMDRHGQFFRIKGGRHQLAIAQNIGIKEIPAILVFYHQDAEEKLPEKRRIITEKMEDFRPFEKEECEVEQVK
jgi:hypothetical protein